MKQRLFSTALFALGLSVCSGASALDLNATLGFKAGIDVQAGLDPATRQLLQELPDDVRQQATRLIQDSLNALDVHVDKYLDSIHSIMSNEIDHAGCVVEGTGAYLIKQLWGSVLPWNHAPGAQDVLSAYAKLDSQFWSSTSPEQYAAGYADFLGRATVTACGNASSPETVTSINQYKDQVSGRWSIWFDLEGRCKNADDCYSVMSAHVQDLLKTSDQRDVQDSGAAALVASTQTPSTGILFWFRQASYESALSTLLRAEYSIGMAKAARESIARQMFNSGKSRVDADAALLAKAQNEFPSGPAHLFLDTTPATNDAGAVIHDTTTGQYLNQAAALMPGLASDVSTQQGRLVQIQQQAASIQQAIQQYLIELNNSNLGHVGSHDMR